MIVKKLRLFLITLILYQTPVFSKSSSLENFNSADLSKYFSGIVALENNDNSKALSFFNSSKILLNKHDPYLKRYIYSLVLENKVSYAINIVKSNKNKKNSNFFDAYLLLILDSLKKGNLDLAYSYLEESSSIVQNDKFVSAILNSLKQYVYAFKEKKILNDEKNFGKFSIISETFQMCFLEDKRTNAYFLNLINDLEGDYTRYIFFYLTYLIENNEINKAKEITNDINHINATILLSQAKYWIDNDNLEKFKKVFSCKNYNDVIGEFLFLISNLYSSQEDFEKSNFYLNLSNFLNPKFIFNLSLVAENHYLNQEYKKVNKILKNFKIENIFYYWYGVKKKTQVIEKQRNKKESLNYISAEFKKIEKPNDKILFDIANFYKNSKEYTKAIEFYTRLIEKIDNEPEIVSDLLYRRGGCFERIGEYEKADNDLSNSLKTSFVLNPNLGTAINKSILGIESNWVIF